MNFPAPQSRAITFARNRLLPVLRTFDPKILTVVACLLLAPAALANADPVTIPNASFELSSPVQTFTNFDVVPNWVFSANVRAPSRTDLNRLKDSFHPIVM
jgi:hypothetical protein